VTKVVARKKIKFFGGQGVCSGADDSSGGVSGFLAGKGLL
jgi:hypothetical protein